MLKRKRMGALHKGMWNGDQSIQLFLTTITSSKSCLFIPYLYCCSSASIQPHRHPPGVLLSMYLPPVQHSQYKLLSPPSGPCAGHATAPVASHWVLKSQHSPPKGLKHTFCYECAAFLQAPFNSLPP